MNTPSRMSPLTAFFLGIFGVGAVGIASGAVIVLYGLRVAETQVGRVFGLAESTVTRLPELMESLPPAFAELLHDRRAPGYAGTLDVKVTLAAVAGTNRVRPALTITNKGDELVTLLGLRVAALRSDGVPACDWTEVVATPLALENDWPGPIMPGGTRHIVLSSRDCNGRDVEDLTAVVEISDVRLWEGARSITAAAP